MKASVSTTTDHWHRHAGTINPVSQVKRPRAPEAAEKRAKDCTITRDEYTHLISCCRTTVEELLIRLSVDAGLRGGETTGLQRQNINMERRTITVKRQGERNTTKTGKRRTAAMTDELRALLTQHLDDLDSAGFDQPDYYFFQGGHGQRLPENN